MIPQLQSVTEFETEIQPSLTYRLDLERKRIIGKIDNEDAIMQMVQKLFMTERYSYVIYSSQYGVELLRFIGKDYDFIVADIERVVSEALLVDDRIISVSDFETKQVGIDAMTVSFKINSVLGEVTYSLEVQAT